MRKSQRALIELPEDAPSVSPRQAGEILGISRHTFLNHVDQGRYDEVPRVRMRGGWKFDVFAIMKRAYPWASKEKIVDYIRDYREKEFARRGKK